MPDIPLEELTSREYYEWLVKYLMARREREIDETFRDRDERVIPECVAAGTCGPANHKLPHAHLETDEERATRKEALMRHYAKRSVVRDACTRMENENEVGRGRMPVAAPREADNSIAEAVAAHKADPVREAYHLAGLARRDEPARAAMREARSNATMKLCDERPCVNDEHWVSYTPPWRVVKIRSGREVLWFPEETLPSYCQKMGEYYGMIVYRGSKGVFKSNPGYNQWIQWYRGSEWAHWSVLGRPYLDVQDMS